MRWARVKIDLMKCVGWFERRPKFLILIYHLLSYQKRWKLEQRLKGVSCFHSSPPLAAPGLNSHMLLFVFSSIFLNFTTTFYTFAECGGSTGFFCDMKTIAPLLLTTSS